MILCSLMSDVQVAYSGFYIWIYPVQFDEGRNEFTGDMNIDAIKSFIRKNQLPIVVEFTQDVSPLSIQYLFLLCRYCLVCRTVFDLCKN